MALSQSGETADTLAAVRESIRKGALVSGLCNVVGSTIAREAGRGVYLHAGPEISVASTKAFTAQVTALLMTALKLGRTRRLSCVEQEPPVVRARHEVRFWPGGRVHAYIRNKTRVYAAFRPAAHGACPLERQFWCAAKDKMVRSKSCSGAHQRTKWCAAKSF